MLKLIAAITTFAALAIPIRAQESKQIHYSVTSLGTLGGKLGSSAHSINDRGWIAGVANLTGDNVEHAALWRDGVVTDLGTLGGSNSNVDFPVKNNGGLIAGFAQTSAVDPLGETFCTSACNPSGGSCDGSNHSCLAFLWQNGVKEPLGTLGGNNSAALGVNNLGIVVGTAENITQDPACMPPQVLDYKAVTWLAGRIHELPAFPGDPIAAAIGVNDNDQVVGGSGNCGSGAGISPIFVHAILWQNDSVTDLGSLGGSINNLAYAINGQAQIVGASDLAGDSTGHAFLWQDGAMADLGTLTGDFSSVAFGINKNGQVVGQSCNSDFSVCRAFLWQAGAMTDLNALIPADSSLSVISGFDINDRGEIVGIALDPNTGEPLAFLAVPCDQEHVGDQGCQDAAQSTIGIGRPKVTLPESVRKELQHRMHFGRL
jgi:probable HAF family extracellular repeat protein